LRFRIDCHGRRLEFARLDSQHGQLLLGRSGRQAFYSRKLGAPMQAELMARSPEVGAMPTFEYVASGARGSLRLTGWRVSLGAQSAMWGGVDVGSESPPSFSESSGIPA
jgi:hypothetical protein